MEKTISAQTTMPPQIVGTNFFHAALGNAITKGTPLCEAAMSFHIDVSAQGTTPGLGGDNATDLLKEILATHKEQLQYLRALLGAQDHLARWRHLAQRWQEDFPDLPAGSKEVLPVLERAYGGLLANLVEELREQGDDALQNDFTLQEFLDRHGMRLGQLGHLLNLLSPLSEACKGNESAEEKKE